MTYLTFRHLAPVLCAVLVTSSWGCGSDSNNSVDASTGGQDAANGGGDASVDASVDAAVDAGPNNGAECTDDTMCDSGNCWVLPFLGAQCGECSADEDCASGGCTIQNPNEMTGATCNTGMAGDGCDGNDVCVDGTYDMDTGALTGSTCQAP